MGSRCDWKGLLDRRPMGLILLPLFGLIRLPLLGLRVPLNLGGLLILSGLLEKLLTANLGILLMGLL